MKKILRGLLALFFLSAASAAADELLIPQELIASIASDQTWRSLIHYNNGRFSNSDPTFLLCSEDCSPTTVLLKTIEVLSSTGSIGKATPCKFPARHLYLSKKFSSLGFALPALECPDLHDFMRKAPADRISLVYVAENVTQPSSMMGHSFLKLSGKNEDGHEVNHAVSFFTRIDTLNFPKLVIDSLFLGMPSFFALVPYSEPLLKYLHEEQRNVWEYQLELNLFIRQLIHLHLWELKDTRSKYLFTEYNCATVIYFILSLANPDILRTRRPWVTPLDVAKQVNKSIPVLKTSLTPASKWKLRMLSAALGKEKISAFKLNYEKKDIPPFIETNSRDEAFLGYELASTFTQFLRQTSSISDERYMALQSALQEESSEFPEMKIDVSQFKNPIDTPDDSQFSLGYLHRNSKNYFSLNILPASHRITDDTSQYFSESSLRLGETTLLLEPRDGNFSVDNFTILGWDSLVPWDSLTGGISGMFSTGLAQHFDETLNAFKAYEVIGGIGLASELHHDILAYGLFKAGAAWGSNNIYPFGGPELGFSLKQLFKMKGRGSYSYNCGQSGTSNCRNELHISQSVSLSRDMSVKAGYTSLMRGGSSEHIVHTVMNFHF